MQLTDSGASHTDWSMIAQAADENDQAAGDALECLVRRYWSAVYAYIRRTGYNVNEAADLTQGFICDIILSRRLCDYADPQRGRFRSLLLSSVRNYLNEKHRREMRRADIVDDDEPLPMDHWPAETRPSDAPEEAFCYLWSATVVRQVLTDVRTACEADGLAAHWTVFEHRVVRPMLLNEPPTDHAALVQQLGLKDESQAANMMVTVKRRFVRALYAEIGRTVIDPDQIEGELRELLRNLERPS